jgi:hypothetical protein
VAVSRAGAGRSGGDAKAAMDIPADPFLSNQTRMMALWDDHAFYTRLFLSLVAAGDGVATELKSVTDRLLLNQDNIAYAFVTAGGLSRANELATKLRNHIDTAGAMISAIINRQGAAAVSSATAAAKVSADAVADAFFDIQSGSSGGTLRSRDQWRADMAMHIDLLAAVARARTDDVPSLTGATDAYVRHLRGLALQLARLAEARPIVGYAFYPAYGRYGSYPAQVYGLSPSAPSPYVFTPYGIPAFARYRQPVYAAYPASIYSNGARIPTTTTYYPSGGAAAASAARPSRPNA